VGLVTRYYLISECCCTKFAVLYLWGALSDERRGLQFAVKSLNGPSRSEPETILYCLIRDSINLEGQFRIYIPQEQGSPVVPPDTRLKLHIIMNNKTNGTMEQVGKSFFFNFPLHLQSVPVNSANVVK
jgi:hypothetical protein